jgi:hypothetical protein
VGLRYLAQLVVAPNRLIPALALIVDAGAAVPAARGHHVLDHRAVAALRSRIRDLRQRVAPSEAEQVELERLTRELGRALGLGGSSRTFADVPERARTAVRKALKRAIDEISAANPAIGQHLAARITTGTLCCYRGPAALSGAPAGQGPLSG